MLLKIIYADGIWTLVESGIYFAVIIIFRYLIASVPFFNVIPGIFLL